MLEIVLSRQNHRKFVAMLDKGTLGPIRLVPDA